MILGEQGDTVNVVFLFCYFSEILNSVNSSTLADVGFKGSSSLSSALVSLIGRLGDLESTDVIIQIST